VDAIDTGVLIWGVKQQSAKDRPDMVSRSIALLASLKRKHSVIMVPSIVAAEYLIDFPLDRQEAQIQVLGRNFFIAPFDAKAAAIAAEIYSKKIMQQAQCDTNLGRQCLKADLKIIATAIAHGAAHIYTNDRHFNSIASGRIIVEDIPSLPAISPIQRDLGLRQ